MSHFHQLRTSTQFAEGFHFNRTSKNLSNYQNPKCVRQVYNIIFILIWKTIYLFITCMDRLISKFRLYNSVQRECNPRFYRACRVNEGHRHVNLSVLKSLFVIKGWWLRNSARFPRVFRGDSMKVGMVLSERLYIDSTRRGESVVQE